MPHDAQPGRIERGANGGGVHHIRAGLWMLQSEIEKGEAVRGGPVNLPHRVPRGIVHHADLH